MAAVTEPGGGSKLGSKLRDLLTQMQSGQGRKPAGCLPQACCCVLDCPQIRSSPERKNLGQRRSEQSWRTGNGAGWDFPCLLVPSALSREAWISEEVQSLCLSGHWAAEVPAHQGLTIQAVRSHLMTADHPGSQSAVRPCSRSCWRPGAPQRRDHI